MKSALEFTRQYYEFCVVVAVAVIVYMVISCGYGLKWTDGIIIASCAFGFVDILSCAIVVVYRLYVVVSLWVDVPIRRMQNRRQE